MCKLGDQFASDAFAHNEIFPNKCVGVVEYPPITTADVSSYYFCWDYQCPIQVGGVPLPSKLQNLAPIIHVRTDIPLINNLTSSSSSPQCVAYTKSDTVRMTYFEHYLPILILWLLLAATLVMSLLHHPVTTVADSAYQTFERERRRREAERQRQIDMERKEMDEAKRFGLEIGQDDSWSTAPLLLESTNMAARYNNTGKESK